MALRTSTTSLALDGELEKLFWAAKLSISCKNPSLLRVEELHSVLSLKVIDYISQTNEKLLDVLMTTEREDLLHLLLNFVIAKNAENQELISKLSAMLELINPAFNPKTGVTRTLHDFLYDLHANPTENLHHLFEMTLKKNPQAINETFEIADITQASDSSVPLIVTINALGYAVRFNEPRTVAALLDAGAQLTRSIVVNSVTNLPVFQYLQSAHLDFFMENETLVSVISKIMFIKEPISNLNKKEQIQLLLTAAASTKIDFTYLERKKLFVNAVKHQPSALGLLLEWDKRFMLDLGKDQPLVRETFSAISRLLEISEQAALGASLIPLISDWVGVLKNPSLCHYLLQLNPSIKIDMRNHINDVDYEEETCFTYLVASEETPEQIAHLKFLLNLTVGSDPLNGFGMTALQKALKNLHYVFAFYLMEAHLLQGSPKGAIAADSAIEALEQSLKRPEIAGMLKEKLAQVSDGLRADVKRLDYYHVSSLGSVTPESELAKTLSLTNERHKGLYIQLTNLAAELNALESSENVAELHAKLLELKSQGFAKLEEVPLLREAGLYKAILELRKEAFAAARRIFEQKDRKTKDKLLAELQTHPNLTAKFVLDAMYELGYLKQEENECLVQSRVASVGLFGSKQSVLQTSATFRSDSSDSSSSHSSSSSDSDSSSEDELKNQYTNWLKVG